MKRDVWNEHEHPERRAQQLMPYEAAAKAIFVKANGLVAYQTATGMSKRTADEQPAPPHMTP